MYTICALSMRSHTTHCLLLWGGEQWLEHCHHARVNMEGGHLRQSGHKVLGVVFEKRGERERESWGEIFMLNVYFQD